MSKRIAQESSKIEVPKEIEDSVHTMMKNQRESSARTSFLLNPKTLDCAQKLASRFGSLKDIFSTSLHILSTFLDQETHEVISMNLTKENFPNQTKIRKSFVLAVEDLERINSLTKKYKTKRDILAENSIMLFNSYIEIYDKDRLEKQKKASIIISRLVKAAQEYETELKEILGSDDLICHALSKEMVGFEGIDGILSEAVEKNQILDKLDPFEG